MPASGTIDQAWHSITDARADVVIETKHGPIRFACPNETTRWRAETLLSKEPETIEWIDRFDTGDVFWDIGASVGPYTLYAAAAGRSRVLAMEPSPASYLTLVRQIALNGFGDRAQAYCLAVAGRTRLDTLHMRWTGAACGGSSVGLPVDESGRPFEASHEQGVVAVTVDDLVERFGAPFPNRIKVDVDGIEESIIDGAARTLADARVKAVSVELDSDRADLVERVQRKMEAGGLRFACKRHAAFVDDSPSANIYNYHFSR